MSIHRLAIKDFRNIDILICYPSKHFNLILGPNGAGKTAVLEAVYLLGRGRSFRTNKNSRLVRFGSSRFAIHCVRDDKRKSAMEVVGGANRITAHIDEKKVALRSTLMGAMPVALLSEGGAKLLSGDAKTRRNFIEWIMFHVEPSVTLDIKNSYRVRTSINMLMRSGRDRTLYSWYSQLAHYDEKIALCMDRTLSELLKVFYALLEDFNCLRNCHVSLFRGWSNDTSLSEKLLQQDVVARKKMYVLSGVHRSDIRFSYRGQPVKEIFSRGQLKVITILFVLSATILISLRTEQRFILLADDIESELDEESAFKVLRILNKQNAQVFLTSSLENTRLKQFISDTIKAKMFHVKHGVLISEPLV